MKILTILASLLLPALLVAKEAEKNCDCCDPTSAAAEKPAAPAEKPKSHPLKGVVTVVLPEKSAIGVQHEEIPGVMRAMTMSFKVDRAVLEKAQPGDAVKGLITRRADGWWLHDVELVPAAPAE